MFIVSLTYKKDLEVVDTLLNDHVSYLKMQYEKGYFIASGRKIPRTGGVILAKAESREILMTILQDDPFFKSGVAEYDVIEFIPSMTSKSLEFFKEI